MVLGLVLIFTRILLIIFDVAVPFYTFNNHVLLQLLHEYKFEFLKSVCNHEHFVQLNLPIMRKTVKNYKGEGRHLYL